MTLTHILVDFENVQPQVADLGLLRGDDFRVRIFHGVHQNKFDVSMYKALQPLGDKVELVQSDRQGPDVLDFHISFYLGRLLQEHLSQPSRAARFFVISKDRGFDSLIVHIRSLGFEAHRVATIRAALGTPVAAAPSPAATAAPKKVAAKKTSPARKPPAVKSAVKAAGGGACEKESRQSEADRAGESATHGQETARQAQGTRASHRESSRPQGRLERGARTRGRDGARRRASNR